MTPASFLHSIELARERGAELMACEHSTPLLDLKGSIPALVAALPDLHALWLYKATAVQEGLYLCCGACRARTLELLPAWQEGPSS